MPEHPKEIAMARKSTAKKTRRAASAPTTTAGSPREKIVAAFMDLLAEKRFETIDLAEIADAANVSLADLRDEFDGKLSILSAHLKQIDRAVLAGSSDEMADESPRDRLFDVLMRRIDTMAPHRAAIKSLMRSASRNPGLTLALNGLAVRTQQWMLTAAGISAAGPKGMLRAQGLALMFAGVVRTFVDDDEDNARTMAALDRALESGQRWSGILDDVCRLVPRPGRRRRRRARYEDDVEAA
jgi:AcrR family transcriptional regulator